MERETETETGENEETAHRNIDERGNGEGDIIGNT